MFAKQCKYDSRNFEHSCMIHGKPCSYLNALNDCPYLAKDRARKPSRDKVR